MITLAEKLLMGSGTKSKPYVEFVSSTPMTITPKYTNSGITLQYSLDGTSWTNITSGATTPSANVIYFRGQATGTKALFTSVSSSTNAWIFSGATNLECNGNINYLLQDSLGNSVEDIPLGSYAYTAMFYGVSSLIKSPDLMSTSLGLRCYQSMFYVCTDLTTPPIIEATTLADYCCYEMFRASSLNILPNLKATTLTIYCYYQMFHTTSIKLSTTLTGIYDTAYRIPTSGTGTTASNALTNMFTNTGGTFAGTPSINTTYYTENTPV